MNENQNTDGAGDNTQDMLLQMKQREKKQKETERRQRMGCVMLVAILAAIGLGLAAWFSSASNAALGDAMAERSDTVFFLLVALISLGVAIWAYFRSRK